MLDRYICTSQRGNALHLLKEVLNEQPRGLKQMVGDLLKEVRESVAGAMRLEDWDEANVLFAEKAMLQAGSLVTQRLDSWTFVTKISQILTGLKEAENHITVVLRRLQENIEAEWRLQRQQERESTFNRLFAVIFLFLSFILFLLFYV